MVNPNNIARLVSLSVFLSFAGMSYAQVPSQLYKQSSTLRVGDPFQISIDLGDASGNDVDLSVLERDFDVLRRGTESSTIMQNGSFERTNKMVIWLSAKTSGAVELPPIPVGSDATQARTLSVQTFDMPGAAEGGLEIVSSLTPKLAYIQQPLIYRATVLIGQPIAGGQFVDPEVLEGKALVEPIGDQRNYTQRLKGREVQVAEKAWLITPQQSGPLSIRSGSVDGQLNSGRRFSLDTEIYSLSIKPKPASFKTQWIPAEDVDVKQTLTKGPYRSGEPITRIVTVTVKGQSEHALQALSQLPDISGFKQYADKPVLDQQYSGDSNELKTVLTLKSTLIPQQAGDLAIPKLTIPWWSTEEDAAKEVIVPEVALTIDAASTANNTATNNTTAPPEPTSSPEPSKAEVITEADPEPLKEPSVTEEPVFDTGTHIPWWQGGLVGLLGLVVGVLITFFVMRKGRHSQTKVVEGQQPIDLSPSRKYILDACDANNPKGLREALLAWGAAVASKPLSLNNLMDKSQEELADQISALQAELYKAEKTGFDCAQFKAAFVKSASELETALKASHKPVQKESLVRLNPEF
jgi:hypothetical protein